MHALKEWTGKDFFVLNKELDFSNVGISSELSECFFNLARSLKDGVIVEIGSGSGCSAISFALGCRGKTKVFSVDAFSFMPALEHLFFLNTSKAGVSERIVQIKALSHAAVRNWDKEIDVLFIDADHSFFGSKLDFLLWERFVKISGIVVLHDYSRQKYLGVWKTVEGEIKQSNRFEELQKNIPECVFFKKRLVAPSMSFFPEMFCFVCSFFGSLKNFARSFRNMIIAK